MKKAILLFLMATLYVGDAVAGDDQSPICKEDAYARDRACNYSGDKDAMGAAVACLYFTWKWNADNCGGPVG